MVFLSSDWQTQWCLALPQTKSIGKFDQFMPPVDWVGKKKKSKLINRIFCLLSQRVLIFIWHLNNSVFFHVLWKTYRYIYGTCTHILWQSMLRLYLKRKINVFLLRNHHCFDYDHLSILLNFNNIFLCLNISNFMTFKIFNC